MVEAPAVSPVCDAGCDGKVWAGGQDFKCGGEAWPQKRNPGVMCNAQRGGGRGREGGRGAGLKRRVNTGCGCLVAVENWEACARMCGP